MPSNRRMNALRHARLVATLLLSLQSFALARGAVAESVVACACCRTDLAHCHCGMHAGSKPQGEASGSQVRPSCVIPQQPALTMLLYVGVTAPQPIAGVQLGAELAASDPPLRAPPPLRREKPPPRPSA